MTCVPRTATVVVGGLERLTCRQAWDVRQAQEQFALPGRVGFGHQPRQVGTDGGEAAALGGRNLGDAMLSAPDSNRAANLVSADVRPKRAEIGRMDVQLRDRGPGAAEANDSGWIAGQDINAFPNAISPVENGPAEIGIVGAQRHTQDDERAIHVARRQGDGAGPSAARSLGCQAAQKAVCPGGCDGRFVNQADEILEIRTGHTRSPFER